MPHAARRKTLVLNVVLGMASTLIALGIMETVARLLYDEPWHEKLVGGQGRSERYPYRLNHRGLRDSEFSPVKQPGERRVLFLGDSFTFGLGVFDDEKVFPRILERRLNESAGSPGLGKVDVLNGGMPVLTGVWLNLWLAVGAEFDLDVVVMVFFLRDGTRTGSISEFFGEIRRDIGFRNEGSLLYEKLFLYRTFRDRLDRLAISHRYTHAFQVAYFGNEEQTAEWRAAQSNLLRIRDLAEQQGAVVGFVVFPILVELNDDYPFRDVCDLLEAFARSHGMPVHNLLNDFMGESGPELWVSSHDQHPNEKGHALAAEALLPFVQELLAESARSDTAK